MPSLHVRAGTTNGQRRAKSRRIGLRRSQGILERLRPYAEASVMARSRSRNVSAAGSASGLGRHPEQRSDQRPGKDPHRRVPPRPRNASRRRRSRRSARQDKANSLAAPPAPQSPRARAMRTSASRAPYSGGFRVLPLGEAGGPQGRPAPNIGLYEAYTCKRTIEKGPVCKGFSEVEKGETRNGRVTATPKPR